MAEPTTVIGEFTSVTGNLQGDEDLVVLGRVEGETPGLRTLRTHDAGHPPEGVHYAMKWETLGSHRDRPREGEAPPPSMLRVYRLVPREE